MTPITREEIERMKASGYEARTIREAEERLSHLQRGEEVAVKIRAAFAGVMLGEGIGLKEARGLDDYEDKETLAKLRADDEKENWERIPMRNLHGQSLVFFDADGIRFHLPAFMIAELRGEEEFDLVFGLTRLSGDPEQNPFSSLNEEQRSAVRAFLIHVLDDPDYQFSRAEIQHALTTIWTDNPLFF